MITVRDEAVADQIRMLSLHGISNTQELNRLFAILAKNTGLEVSIEELTRALGVAKNTLRRLTAIISSQRARVASVISETGAAG